jgi:uncharacterized protein YfbU (UPF0304 family)
LSDYDNLNAPTSLSPFERQTLAFHHQILSYLDASEADYHRRMREALNQGFTAEYGGVFSLSSELPYDDCLLLHNILNMFRVIKDSIGALDEAEREALLADHKYTLCFRGFDGNDARESKMSRYVDYLQTTGRWTDLTEDVKAAGGGNSHAPMLAKYQSMLGVFRPISKEAVRGGGHALMTAEQLRQIAESRG